MNKEKIKELNRINDEIDFLELIIIDIEHELNGSRDKIAFGIATSSGDEPEDYGFIDDKELTVMLRDVTYKYCKKKLVGLNKKLEKM